MSDYPRINLAIDNCFASKRWTRPYEWMSVIRDLGLSYAEASADTEADPLYFGQEYFSDWLGEVEDASGRTGVQVANLYSGHGSYVTLGLAHTDRRIRRRVMEQWVGPMLRAARQLRAGLGFYLHAFPVSVLQDPEVFHESLDALYDILAEVAVEARKTDAVTVSLEQMYSPQQVPWTIAGARDLLATVAARSGSELYLTIDTGHQTGQRRFFRPSADTIRAAISRGKPRALVARESVAGNGVSESSAEGISGADTLWLGPDPVYEPAHRLADRESSERSESFDELVSLMDRYPYLFSDPEDGETSAWLRALGRYSPIIHLQQVVGDSSSHLPFTATFNAAGRVHPEEVLRAVAGSYEKNATSDTGMPARCREISLTLEIFSGTAETPREILAKLRESVTHWRRYVPRDGMPLDELVAGES